MPTSPRTLQMSFAGGEMSPEMYSRATDPQARAGAARVRNMIPHPRGSVSRRPGFQHVREVKSSASAVRLLPFRYSIDQTLAIEMGRATVDSRSIGYFRFHTDGATQLQLKPDDYVPTIEPTSLALTSATVTFTPATDLVTWAGHTLVDGDIVSFTVSGGSLPGGILWSVNYYVINSATNTFQLTTVPNGNVIDITTAGSGTITAHGPATTFTSATHEFQTGDPIVPTMRPGSFACTFTTSAGEITTGIAHGFRVDDSVMFTNVGGALPPGIVEDQIYYIVVVVNATTFRISTQRRGTRIEYASAGSGTQRVGALPNAGSGAFGPNLDVNTVYYAIRLSPTTFQLASSPDDAANGTPLQFTGSGTVAASGNGVRMHYGYGLGSIALDANGSPYYCRRVPWGETGSRKVYAVTHEGIEPTDIDNGLRYWYRQPGAAATVTFDATFNKVQWVGHPVSEGDEVTFTNDGGSLPAEIVAGTVYYARNIESNAFQLSASLTSLATIDLSGAGSPTTTAFAGGVFEVPHDYEEDELFQVNTIQSADVLTIAHVDHPLQELRRRGATHWTLNSVAFNGDVPAPIDVAATTFAGEGLEPSGVTNATPAVISFPLEHNLAPAERVQVVGVGDIPDGHYVVDDASPSSVATDLTLKNFETGASIGSSTTSVSSSSVVRSSGYADDWVETYVVTALNDNDEEGPPSAELDVTNNLLALDARNTLTWGAVATARRYRVYRSVQGLFGFIGEVEAPATTFVDNNIDPDLTVTPPIIDRALRRTSFVTFDYVAEGVLWVGHGLEAGTPIVFDGFDRMPDNVPALATFYVFDPTPNFFQLTTTPDGTTALDLGLERSSGPFTAEAGEFPGAIAYFEQRRVFGGSRKRPQDLWLTASGTESDVSYSIPTVDSDRIQIRLAARERSQILHALPVGNLVILTTSAEWRVTPLDSDALTPTSVSARPPTHVGTARGVAPVIVNNVALFAAARGGHLREMGFLDTVGDYVTGDLSLRATHLFEGRTLVQMAFHQAPTQVVWAVSSAGTLLGLTYLPEERIAGWSEHDVGGDSDTIESVAVVAEGDEDRAYIVSNRGGTRYVERMAEQDVNAIADLFYVDLGTSYSGAAVTQIYVPQLASQAVAYLADGVKGTATVSAAGVLTVPTAASKIQVGLAYSSQLQTMPVFRQVDEAWGVGRTKNIDQMFVRVEESGAFQAGPDLSSLVPSDDPATGELLSELVDILPWGAWSLEGQVWIEQSDPLPLTVAGVTLEIGEGG